MGTKWNKYNRCPYCSSTRIKSNKKDNSWYCLKCKKEWNGKETLSIDFASNYLISSEWTNPLPNDSWIVINNHTCTVLENDFYFEKNEFNPSRRDNK